MNLNLNKTCILSPGWYGSVDWKPACEPKGHWFNSQSGHKPNLQARSLVGGVWVASNWCFSHIGVSLSLLISLPSPPSIKTSKHTKNLYLDLRLFLFIHLDPSASAHSKVVIFTVNSLGTSQSYLDVVQRNVDMFRALVPALGHYSPNSILLVASQPGKRFCLKWVWWCSTSVELPLLIEVIKLDYKGTTRVFS